MKKTLIALLAALTLLAAVPQASFAADDLPTPPPVEDGEGKRVTMTRPHRRMTAGSQESGPYL